MDAASKVVTLILPWPPSVNRYWRRNGGRYFISAEGMTFRQHVNVICHTKKNVFIESDRLCMDIKAFPPDKRRRDLDNILKAIGDALQHAGIYHDDNQIDEIRITRQPSLLGEVSITLTRMECRSLQKNCQS